MISGDVTRWLAEWRRGDAAAGERMIEAFYPELNRMAAGYLAGERAGHTLEPNALVSELWLRLRNGNIVSYADRSHFVAVAAQTMRRILVDHACARVAEKRGGTQHQVSLSAVDGWNPVAHDEDLISLHDALVKLERADSRAARVVELRFFGGLEGAEIAEALGVSEITVKRDWRVARAWLASRLSS